MASTASTTYVNGLYTNLIGFTDPAGAAAWAGQIDAGTSPYNVANAFLDVYQQSAAPVALLYQAAFGRVPDYAGFTYWLNNFKTVSAGNTLLLSQQFYNSAEFAARIGGDPTTLTDSNYVLALYQNVLGRPGDFNGVTYWANWLTAAEAAGGNTDAAKDAARNQLLDVFAASAENVSVNGKQIETFTIYTAFNGRVPTAAEFTAAQGQSELTVVTGVVAASPNYGATGAAPVPVFPLTQVPDVTTVTEGNTVTFTVNLNTPALVDSTYTFNINGATNAAITQAASSADFVAANGTFVVKAGATTGTFKVATVTGDGTEPLEGFKVSILDAKLNPLLDSAILAIQDNTQGGGVGQTFVLTTGVDNIVGTASDDTIIGDNTGTNATSTAGDQVNGNAGTDIFKYYAKAADTTITLPTLTGVETLYVNGGAITALTPPTTALTGITTLSIDAPVVNTAATYTLNNQSIILANHVVGANTTTTVAAAATATDTFQNVTLNNWTRSAAWVNTLDVTGAKIATLNLTTTGAASIIALANTGGAKITTLNLAGDKNLTLTESAALAGAITKVDASTATGNMSVNATAALTPATFTFTGGAGNDTITFIDDEFGTLLAGTQLDGGAGAGDKIGLFDSALTAAETAKINATKGFEVLGLNAAITLDASTLTSIKQFSIDTTALTQTISSLATGSTVTVTAAAPTSLTLGTNVGVTDVAINLGTATSAGITVGTLVTTGITNIALSSNGTAANTITTLTNSDNTTFTVTGSDDLTFALSAGTAVGSKVSAAAFTGKLTVTGSAITTSGDTLIGGSGADTINGGRGADTLTGNAGADIFSFTATATANANGATFGQADVITDFLIGTDKLQFAGVADVVSGQQGAVQTAVTALAAGSTDAQIATAMATANTTNLGVSFAVFGGNTYVLYETAGAGTGVVADDVFIKLTGVTTLPTFAGDVVA